MNAHILAATESFRERVQQDGSQRASAHELQQLDAEQADRAEVAEQLGGAQPELTEQLAAMGAE